MRADRTSRFLFMLLPILMLLSASLPTPTPAHADTGSWTSNGPDDEIGTIAVAPSDNLVVYAMGKKGLWKTVDGGTVWSLAGTNKFNPYAPLAVDPRNPAVVYSSAALGPTGNIPGGIIKSLDGGRNWGLLRRGGASAITVDPSRPDTVYAGLGGGTDVGEQMQILKSTDGGATWAPVTDVINVSPGVPYVSGIAIVPERPDIVFASMQVYHGGFTMRSMDGGAKWKMLKLKDGGDLYLMRPDSLAVSPTTGNSRSRVYVGWGLMGTKALMASADDGETWEKATDKLPSGGGVIFSLVAPTADGTIIASIGAPNARTKELGGVFVSRDGGESWVQLGTISQAIGRVAWAPKTQVLYLATNAGVYQYTVPESGFPYAVSPRFRGYYDSRDGNRLLGSPISTVVQVGEHFSQYFEKGRLEDHKGESEDPNWQFMYGLLVDDLQQAGAKIPVGGDIATVTYADIKHLAAEDRRVDPPDGLAGGVADRPDGSVFVPFTTDLSPAPGHNVFGPFWDFINNADLFPAGWMHDIGLPTTEPVKATVDKGPVKGREIIIQAFQRTVLTYDPLNPPDRQVERANVGTDYRKVFPANVPK